MRKRREGKALNLHTETTMRAILAGLTVLLVVGCAGPETATETREQAQALVDGTWLRDNLDAVVVLDIRADRADQRPYEAGHVPGAVHSPYGQDPWRVTRDGLPGMLPPVEDLERLIGGLGISNDDHVVIVSAGRSAGDLGSSTRVYWEFKVLGHDRVSILNGGFTAWANAGYPTEIGRSQPTATIYTADYQPQLVASAEDVVAALESGVPLIDARSESQYRGEVKSRVAARYGTISGAKNLPGAALTVGDVGTFASAEVVASLWAAAGLPAQGEQVAFCSTGHAASLAWFAAYELIGNKEAKLYDASLAEWSAFPDLPMDNTDNPNRQ
ncbi:MAG: sulfurtransferase [Gemmatimonadota bacterium]|nr:MAG: sulfurtransferase [Gemmatimonadota bacterium]